MDYGIICRLWLQSTDYRYKNQFQTKTLSQFCEDPGVHINFFFKSADYKPKIKIIHICLSTSKETTSEKFLIYNVRIMAIICGLLPILKIFQTS